MSNRHNYNDYAIAHNFEEEEWMRSTCLQPPNKNSRKSLKINDRFSENDVSNHKNVRKTILRFKPDRPFTIIKRTQASVTELSAPEFEHHRSLLVSITSAWALR